MQIELSRDEAEILRNLLQHQVREMDREISRTDSLDFKRDLQQTDRAMERILGRLVLALEQRPQ
jgi:AAA+ ATPase superfamily predicted ATPase